MSPLVTTTAGLGAEAFGFTRALATAGGYECIATTILGSTAPSITFSSIPNLYRHLEIRYTAQSSGNNRTLFMRVNGDTTTSYVNSNIAAANTSISANTNTGRTDMLLATLLDPTFEGNVFTTGIITIADYKETSKHKTLRMLAGFNGDSQRNAIFGAGMWAKTNAIDSITLGVVADNMAAGSRFSLYGIRG